MNQFSYSKKSFKYLSTDQLQEGRREMCSKHMSVGASKKKNKRTTVLQSRIDTLYHRYSNYLITASDLINGLSFVVAEKYDLARK